MSQLISLKGTCALVTGANSGIGLVTAKKLAEKGAKVILACRSKEKADRAIDSIRQEYPLADVQFLELDLADLKKVRTAAETLLTSQTQIDILINNAGLFGLRGTTQDGFEMHFGTNHLGPYLFTRLLLPLLKKSAPSRIVIVSSHGHYSARELDFDSFVGKTRSRWSFPEYATSKLCNVLFAKGLAARLEGTGVSVYSLHPGIIASDIWRSFPQPIKWLVTLPMISNEEGAITTLHCATHPDLASETGLYYDKCAHRRPSKLACDEKLQEKLWHKSAEWTDLP
jgi:NAD(P)-dependent dehydrogenase (short-subunit alcohol dehydrogenase family)